MILLFALACDGSVEPPPPTVDSPPPDSGPDCEVHPEACNGLDDDCDGLVDDADPDLVDGLPFWADADGDGHGADTLVLACALGPGAALSGGDCDDGDPAVHPGAEEACDGVDTNCDGEASTVPGQAASCPAASCLALLQEAGVAADGAYWLALPSGGAAQVWCDMAGGGWTLGFLRNTASTGSQADFGYGEVGLAGLAQSAQEGSASSVPALGWLDLEGHPWTELQLAAYSWGAETYRSRSISREDLRIPFGSDGYYLYGEGGYYWCGGAAAYTDGGEGAQNNPAGAPPDCKYHGSLGSGWDFSESNGANAGLTLCGGDGSYFLAASWGGSWTWYGSAGGAQAIWVR